jgi:hypothetical protein
MSECVRRFADELDELEEEDRETVVRSIRALDLARHPQGLVFGFGGTRQMVRGAKDDLCAVWNRRHPDQPVVRAFWDDLMLELRSYDAILAR